MNNISISLGKRQLADLIWKATKIEGFIISFWDIEKILYNQPVMTKRDEMLFVVEMERTWNFLFTHVADFNNLDTLMQIRKVYAMDTYNVEKLRTVPVTIGGTSWKPEMPEEELVVQKLLEIDAMENKLEDALEMFCYLSRSQLFLDGNKRLAQLMCNKILMQYDLGIFSIPYDRIDYFKYLLIDFYETNQSDKLKGFFRAECLLLNPATNH